MLQALENFATNSWPTAIGIAVILMGIGFTIAAKFDSKGGYIIALVGLLLALYVLYALGVLGI